MMFERKRPRLTGPALAGLALVVALGVAGVRPSPGWAAAGGMFQEQSRRAEEALQAGKAAAGVKLLLPFAGGPASHGEEVRRMLERFPFAGPAFVQTVEHTVRSFKGKGGAFDATRLLDSPSAQALIPEDRRTALRAVLAERAAEQNRTGKATWLLTDAYAGVPGLASPDQERLIFARTLERARSKRSDEATASLLVYVRDHPDDADARERLNAALPAMRFRRPSTVALAVKLFPDFVPPGAPMASPSSPPLPAYTDSQFESEMDELRRMQEEILAETWRADEDDEQRWRQKQYEEERRWQEYISEQRRRTDALRDAEQKHRAEEARRAAEETHQRFLDSFRMSKERHRKEIQERQEPLEKFQADVNAKAAPKAEWLRQQQEERRRHDDAMKRRADEEKDKLRRQAEADQQRAAEERRRAEEQKRVEEQRRAEKQKHAEEDKRRSEEQRRAEERKHAEEQRRAEEQHRANEQRRAEEQRRADKRKHVEEQRRAEEQHRAEEQRRADERKHAEEQHRAEEQRRRATR